MVGISGSAARVSRDVGTIVLGEESDTGRRAESRGVWRTETGSSAHVAQTTQSAPQALLDQDRCGPPPSVRVAKGAPTVLQEDRAMKLVNVVRAPRDWCNPSPPTRRRTIFVWPSLTVFRTGMKHRASSDALSVAMPTDRVTSIRELLAETVLKNLPSSSLVTSGGRPGGTAHPSVRRCRRDSGADRLEKVAIGALMRTPR